MPTPPKTHRGVACAQMLDESKRFARKIVPLLGNPASNVLFNRPDGRQRLGLKGAPCEIQQTRAKKTKSEKGQQFAGKIWGGRGGGGGLNKK